MGFLRARRIVTLRSAAIWQTDLALAAWASVCAAAASYYSVKPPGSAALPFGLTAVQGVGVIFAAGFLLGLALRSLFLKWDYRFVTDERTYFFADTGHEAFFCPRVSIRSVSHHADGIVLDLETHRIRVGEEPAAILLAIQNVLAQWAEEDRRPPSTGPGPSGSRG